MSNEGSSEGSEEPNGIHLTTSIIKSERICTWEIKEFSSYIDIFQVISPQSEEFPSNYDYYTKFQLKVLYSQRQNRHAGSDSYIIMLKIKPSEDLQKCVIETSLQNGSPTELNSKSMWTKNQGNSDINLLEIESSIILARELTDSLFIKCIINEFYISNEENPDFHRCSLTIDFDRLLEENILPDFTFNVGDESFKVHKSILAVRSPVFHAMFHQNLSEKNKNVVDVPDIEPAAFKEMLRFIYTGNVKNMKIMAFDLLRAADKYQLEELKTLCEKAFCDISVREAPSLLLLADRHNAKVLKEKTLHFIRKHIKEAIGSEEFLQLYTRKDLIQEVMETVVNK